MQNFLTPVVLGNLQTKDGLRIRAWIYRTDGFMRMLGDVNDKIVAGIGPYVAKTEGEQDVLFVDGEIVIRSDFGELVPVSVLNENFYEEFMKHRGISNGKSKDSDD